MGSPGTKQRLSVGATVAAVALCGIAVFAAAADAKKKPKKTTVTRVARPNALIPDAIGVPGPPRIKTLDGSLRTTLDFSTKRLKKMIAIRVAITVQTTGLAPNAAANLDGVITAPDGTTVQFFNGLRGQSIGPLRVQPNYPFTACSYDPAEPPPPCPDPFSNVYPPYVGTVGIPDLTSFNGVGARGPWVVTILDRGYNPDMPRMSILNSVAVELTPVDA